MCWKFIRFLWLNHQNNAYGAHGKQAHSHTQIHRTISTHYYFGPALYQVCVHLHTLPHTFISENSVNSFTLQNVSSTYPRTYKSNHFSNCRRLDCSQVHFTCMQTNQMNAEALINWFNNNCRAMNLSDITLVTIAHISGGKLRHSHSHAQTHSFIAEQLKWCVKQVMVLLLTPFERCFKQSFWLVWALNIPYFQDSYGNPPSSAPPSARHTHFISRVAFSNEI